MRFQSKSHFDMGVTSLWDLLESASVRALLCLLFWCVCCRPNVCDCSGPPTWRTCAARCWRSTSAFGWCSWSRECATGAATPFQTRTLSGCFPASLCCYFMASNPSLCLTAARPPLSSRQLFGRKKVLKSKSLTHFFSLFFLFSTFRGKPPSGKPASAPTNG